MGLPPLNINAVPPGSTPIPKSKKTNAGRPQ
jgi:hypothetical protein